MQRHKDSSEAFRWLQEWYAGVDTPERAAVDQIIESWVASSVEAKRYDAVALVDEFRIKSALPALVDLHTLLRASSYAGAPFEAEKVERVIASLQREL